MQAELSKIRVGIVDDHQLFTKAVSLLISGFREFEIILEASHGKDLQKKIPLLPALPHIMLIDVNMPFMDGPATASWLKEKYPEIRLVALSMNDQEDSMIKMFRSGCTAYMFKDIHPKELERGLLEVHARGYYNPESHPVDFKQLLHAAIEEDAVYSKREIEFIKLCCSDFTYKEISVKMNLSANTVDRYRDTLFKKFKVNSRTGLVLKALRKKLIKI